MQKEKRQQFEVCLALKCGSVEEAALEFLREGSTVEFSEGELDVIIGVIQAQIKREYSQIQKDLGSTRNRIAQAYVGRLLRNA